MTYAHETSINKRAAAVLALMTALCAIFIWSNSLWSIEDSSNQSSFITSLLLNIFRDADFGTLQHIIRKCAHFTEFAALGAFSLGLTYTVCRRDLSFTWSATAFPVLGCLLVASTDETIQIYSGRGNSVSDVLLDFSGSLTAMCVFYIVLLIANRRKNGTAQPALREFETDEEVAGEADDSQENE